MTGRATSMQRAAAETVSMEAVKTLISELRTDLLASAAEVGKVAAEVKQMHAETRAIVRHLQQRQRQVPPVPVWPEPTPAMMAALDTLERLAELLERTPPRPVMTEDQVRQTLAPTTMAARKIAASASNLARSADHRARRIAQAMGVGFAIPTVAAVLLMAWALFLR